MFHSREKGFGAMSENPVFKKIEIVGTSSVSMEDAIQSAIAKAAQSLRNLRWFEVVETRGSINEGRVAQWQVTLRIGFRLESDAEDDD
jgi:flavin-binding protein dodecin